MGELADNFHLFPVFEYWSSGYSIGGFDFDLSNIQIGAETHYGIENVEVPWAVAFGSLSDIAFWSMMAFLSVLTIGFAYEWKKGAMEWQ